MAARAAAAGREAAFPECPPLLATVAASLCARRCAAAALVPLRPGAIPSSSCWHHHLPLSPPGRRGRLPSSSSSRRQGPCSSASPQCNLGLCRGLKYSRRASSVVAWTMRARDKEPPYRDPVLHPASPTETLSKALCCTSTHRASSRCAGEKGTRKPPQQGMREKCLCAAPAHVHLAHAAIFCWSAARSPHLARSADWHHGPCSAPAPCFSGGNSSLDLTALCQLNTLFCNGHGSASPPALAACLLLRRALSIFTHHKHCRAIEPSPDPWQWRRFFFFSTRGVINYEVGTCLLLR